jgi:PKD domain-containing protein/fibronectin type III domain protein
MSSRTPRTHPALWAQIGFATVIALATMMPAITAWAAAGPPRFINYQFPTGIGDDSGEPSIGSNWTREQSFMNSSGIPLPNGGSVNYFGGFQKYMTNVIYNDCASPARVEWHAKHLLTSSTTRVYGDPILFTDHQTGRTFAAQLEGLTPLGSTVDITDNDGDIFTPSEGSGLPSCIDHQTIGGGPYHAPLVSPPPPAYPNAVYYASQCGLSPGPATVALSVDGGYTYGPSVTMWTTQCAGLHGHLKVGPDGTVYVPVRNCSGNTGVAVSENNGVTWAIRTIPSTPSGDRDPSCGAANDGNTVYLGWQGADGHPRVAVSHNKGVTWLNVTDVGASVGVIRCAFPAVVAGDANRAAFSFFGSNANGAYDSPSYPGNWYLYIATTSDGGVTWTTQNVTPNDPIQRGGICGVANPDCRNLLDFYDMTIDKEGRILIGYDDGCIGGCTHNPPNSFTSQGAIARQSGGMRMFSTYDPVEPALAQAPNVTANKFGTSVLLTWPAPDNSGATITSYKVYRQVNGGAFSLRATVNETQYLDTINPDDTNVYRVTAVNSQGEGPYCSDIVPIDGPPPSSCTGIVAVTDIFPDGGNNDFEQNTPADPTVNIRTLTMSEPYLGPGINQTWFKLQVEPSLTGLAPPNSQWYIVWNRLAAAADGSDRRFLGMRTDATGMPIFIYGDWGPPLPIGGVPPPHFNEPLILGWPDFASYDPAAGVILMKLSNSKLDKGGRAAGSSLVDLNVRTYLSRPDSGQRSQNNASDITANGNYTLAGNAACFVNTAPVARLVADPTSGVRPLTVNFDASTSSDVDAGDFVASYTINYGDGTPPVTQSSPMFSHQYVTASGTSGYFVTLTVKDSYGLQSINTASANILVTEGTSVGGLELASAEAEPGQVKLTWQSFDQQVLAGTVYRRGSEGGWTKLGQISPDNAGMMTYVDHDVVAGATYGYRLGVIQNGQELHTAETIVIVPRALFALSIPQNPARDGMSFTLALDRDGPVSVTVFSPAGRRVAKVVDAWMPAGKHTLRWGGQDLSGNQVSAGVYLLQAKSGDRSRMAQVSLLR